jgi:hypothetical protein
LSFFSVSFTSFDSIFSYMISILGAGAKESHA